MEVEQYWRCDEMEPIDAVKLVSIRGEKGWVIRLRLWWSVGRVSGALGPGDPSIFLRFAGPTL